MRIVLFSTVICAMVGGIVAGLDGRITEAMVWIIVLIAQESLQILLKTIKIRGEHIELLRKELYRYRYEEDTENEWD